MKKKILAVFLVVAALGSVSMAAHKYYVGVFQMEYVPQKKEIQVTSRVFIDDMEAALNKKYGKKFYLGSARELPGSNEFLQKYFTENISVTINGRAKTFKYLGREVEDDILICYYTIPAEGAIKTIKLKNTVLFDFSPDQQNYIHFKINSNKKSLLLTNDEQEGTLEF